MLPIEKVKIREFEKAIPRSIGWSKDYPGETFLVGTNGDWTIAAAFGGDKLWSAATYEISSFGAFIDDIEFRVDPQSFSKFEHLEDATGALLVHRDEIRVCTLNPNGRGTVKIVVGHGKVEGVDVFAGAFTKWRAVTMVDGKPMVLFEKT